MEPQKLDRDFTIARSSPIEGIGLFAKKNIPKGTRIAEYAGKRVLREDLTADLQAGLSSLKYVMNLNETTVIDGERDGNDTRFINHCCEPNCIVYFFNEIPYIYSLTEIPIDTELSFDYQMSISREEVLFTSTQKQQIMPCFCGSKNCRGTLLSD